DGVGGAAEAMQVLALEESLALIQAEPPSGDGPVQNSIERKHRNLLLDSAQLELDDLGTGGRIEVGGTLTTRSRERQPQPVALELVDALDGALVHRRLHVD